MYPRSFAFVKIGGFPANSSKAKQILGYVPEFPCLYDMLTVREQFEFVVRAYKLDREKSRRYAAELVDRLRLTEVVDTLCKDLSKGMQQKVSIICALLPRPKLLLLDEPMLGLDPHAIKELKNYIEEMRQAGKTMLISTHIIDSVDMLWDRTVIMQNGQVCANVTRSEIESAGKTLEDQFFLVTEGISPASVKAPVEAASDEYGNASGDSAFGAEKEDAEAKGAKD